MGNLIKKLFTGGKNECCDVKIEEVKAGEQSKNSKKPSCCGADTNSKKN